MLLKIASIAFLAAVALPFAAMSQTISQVGGPAERPPASFEGLQYVDSRGCVFLRAGYGGQVNWVPRVSRDRKAMCGVAPTFGQKEPVKLVEAKPAAPVREKAQPKATGAPLDTIASIKTPPKIAAKPVQSDVPQASYTPAPTVVRAPVVAVPSRPAPQAPAVRPQARSGYEVVASNGVPKGQIGCYTSAPVAERVRLRSGGTAVVCTRGDGTLDGWRSPIYPAGSPVGPALSDYEVRYADTGQKQATVRYATADVARPAQTSSDAIPTPPPGYKLAWTDDRLNPNRGKGTATGQAAQDQIWTRKVPARLVADQGTARQKRKVVVVSPEVTVSTKSNATAPVRTQAPSGSLRIQVGTFGVASNAEAASARLLAAGLPVTRARITSKGKPMQIIYAGPFASAAQARQALQTARGAGFGDAFIK